jgi:hypothetical protein
MFAASETAGMKPPQMMSLNPALLCRWQKFVDSMQVGLVAYG